MTSSDDELRPEYDLKELLKDGELGKYADRELLPNPARALTTFPFIVYGHAYNVPAEAIGMCHDWEAVVELGTTWLVNHGAGAGYHSLDLRTWESGPSGECLW